MANCIVVGGGPAGMMAACMAAGGHGRVTLLEQNEKPGKKLYITGKGRCNVTNAVDNAGLQARVMANPRFLYSAFAAFGSADLMAFLEDRGVRLVVERGKRVFPQSGHAVDVTRALTDTLRERGAALRLRQRVTDIETKNGKVRAVVTERGRLPADAVIIATGGLSYPSTGSTGDGYAWARRLGHGVTPTFPSLVSLTVKEGWVSGLAGLSLKNARCSVHFPTEKKAAYSEVGELLFTPAGITGPLVLSASRYVTHRLDEGPFVSLDLKPGLTPEMLDERLLRDFAAGANKDFRNGMQGLLPERLLETLISLSGIPPEKKLHSVTKAERQKLGALLKDLRLTPAATGGYKEAVVTMGGVDVREIDPRTCMSKKVGGLFFAGEVLDVDAMTGGFNLQIAFSTGCLAGKAAQAYLEEGI